MHPPLGEKQSWDMAPPPGERSDHGTPGHGLFLGPTADGLDMGSTHLPVYAIERLELYSTWFHYSSADGQPYGWVALLARPNGLSVAYAHLQDRPEKNIYEEGEQIGIISNILNVDHLHFEMDEEVAGDMPAKLGGGDMGLTDEQDQRLKDINATTGASFKIELGHPTFSDGTPVPHNNFTTILEAVAALKATVDELKAEVVALKLTGGTVDLEALAKVVNDDAAARLAKK